MNHVLWRHLSEQNGYIHYLLVTEASARLKPGKTGTQMEAAADGHMDRPTASGLYGNLFNRCTWLLESLKTDPIKLKQTRAKVI